MRHIIQKTSFVVVVFRCEVDLALSFNQISIKVANKVISIVENKPAFARSNIVLEESRKLMPVLRNDRSKSFSLICRAYTTVVSGLLARSVPLDLDCRGKG
jgi:hypothetical protein